jgi:hypothetical protein
MTISSAYPSTTPSVESDGGIESCSRALKLFANAGSFLRNTKSILEHCPGYRALKSQLDLSVPFLETVIDKRAVDGFRVQRTIELLRTLHTFLLEESTRRNIDTSGIGVMEWAYLVLPITDIIAALKGVLRQPPTAVPVTTTHL